MKICFMNDFQTSIKADLYIACLPQERPILHPAIILQKNRLKVLEVSKQMFKSQNQESQLIETNKIVLTPSSVDTLRASFSIEDFNFDWKHCDLFTLTSALSEALEDKLEISQKWTIISFGEDESASGMWIFKKQNPVLYLPLGTPSSMATDAESHKAWILKKDEISLITLKNYFEVLTNQKTIFELDEDSQANLKILALIRFLIGNSLVYGCAHSIENLRHLKFFNFLTHDTPISARVSLSQLEKKLSPLIGTLDLTSIISKHDAYYLEKHS